MHLHRLKQIGGVTCIAATPVLSMLKVIEVVLLLSSVFVRRALGKNGCRQCSGERAVKFNQKLSAVKAQLYFDLSFKRCATNSEYEVRHINPSNCEKSCLDADGMPGSGPCEFLVDICDTYSFQVQAWRYCGNGPLVALKISGNCEFGLCTTLDELHMSCTHSVECVGKCDSKSCDG